MTVDGIDVSENDGAIDWRKVAAAGYKFAIAKVCEGNYSDPTFNAGRVHAIRSNGMIPGGYVYLRPRPGRTGDWEARQLIRAGRAAGMWRQGTGWAVRPVLDIEASEWDLATTYGRWKTKRYIKQAIRQIRRELNGHRPIIYTGSFWREALADWPDSSGCPLWLAAYVRDPNPYIPRAWRRIAIWQHSERGQVPGIRTHVDLDRYQHGGEAEFRRECCLHF